MYIVPELEIEGNWGAKVNLQGREGDLIKGKTSALVSGSFVAAELRKELGWQSNFWLRERGQRKQKWWKGWNGSELVVRVAVEYRESEKERRKEKGKESV